MAPARTVKPVAVDIRRNRFERAPMKRHGSRGWKQWAALVARGTAGPDTGVADPDRLGGRELGMRSSVTV